jgi:hypothetical protein
MPDDSQNRSEVSPPGTGRSESEVQSILRAELVWHCWLVQLEWDLLVRRIKALDSFLSGGPAPPGLEGLDQTALGRHKASEPEMQQVISLRLALWEPVQVILESCAIVGRTLFPTGGEDCPYCGHRAKDPSGFQQSRAKLILQGLTLPALPNLASHKARNVLAHVEDRVMKWAELQLSTNPKAKLGDWLWGRGAAPGPVFRYLDYAAWTFRAGDAECNLRGMVEETRVVARIIPIVQEIEFNVGKRETGV